MKDGGAMVVIDDTAPDVPFDSMSINRLDVLLSSISMLQSISSSSLSIDAEIGERVREGETHRFIRQLNMTAGGATVTFKCTHPNVLRIPRKLKDENAISLTIDEQAINFLSMGQRMATSTGDFSIKLNTSSTTYSMMHSTEDTMTFAGRGAIALDEDVTLPQEYKFSNKGIIDLLKMATSPLIFTKKMGFMTVDINGTKIYIARNI